MPKQNDSSPEDEKMGCFARLGWFLLLIICLALPVSAAMYLYRDTAPVKAIIAGGRELGQGLGLLVDTSKKAYEEGAKAYKEADKSAPPETTDLSASERPTSGPLSDKVSELTTQNDAIQVYFAPCQPLNPLGVDDALVSFIGSARRSVYCAFYDLQLDVVAEALIERHKLGIPVRIVTDSDYMDREALKLCTQAGIPVAEDSRKPFMHNKFCVVDGEKVWTGSTNVTENCMYKNNNNALAITSVDLAEDYAKEFMEMFERREFGDRKSWGTPRPEVLVGNVRIECFFSPEDRVLKAVIRTVNEAKATIDFMAFSFTSQEIAEAMASRVNKGVRVRGLFEGRNANSQYSQDDFLEQKGAKVYLDENEDNMHNKVIIVDTETVITGSYNFSDNAEKNNDENLLILHSTDIATKYEQEFNRLTGN